MTSKNTDPVIFDLVSQIIKRSDEGIIKYGRTMEDAEGDVHRWVDEAIEEVLDCAVYLVKLRRVLKQVSDCQSIKAVPRCTCADCARKISNSPA